MLQKDTEKSTYSKKNFKKMNLLKDPISLLLKKIALPASVATLFQTLFNIVDTFYAGKISSDESVLGRASTVGASVGVGVGAGVSIGVGVGAGVSIGVGVTVGACVA